VPRELLNIDFTLQVPNNIRINTGDGKAKWLTRKSVEASKEPSIGEAL